MNDEIKRISIPATRNPFVNAQLVPAGNDPKTGEERFWTSSLNYIDGCIGALVTESGSHKLYRFKPDRNEGFFYGAAYAGSEIMWLTSFLDTVTRLDLRTGETITYETGLPHSLSVSGLTYDRKTGKLFQMAYCQDDMTRKGFSFDTRTNIIVKVFPEIPITNKQLRCSIKNNDGTYTLMCSGPGIDVLLWNPTDDSLEVLLENYKMGANLRQLDYSVAIQRDDGAIFLPAYGWFDPVKRKFAGGPMPSVAAAWFDADLEYAYGSKTMCLGNTILYRWNLKTGDIKILNEIPDSITYSFKLTGNNKIVCVNMYGFFYRIDANSGAIETSVKFDSDGIGHIDCVYKIDEERLLCTPFITQRFYEISLSTRKARDLGRATGGMGEVLQVTGMENKIYMASYTKGQLVEYDPSQPAHFPENPRIVAAPVGKAMRPVAMCQKEDTIYYSCSHEYGYLGSTLISHKPSAGETKFVENPIPNHMIRSLEYDEKLGKLIAATTYHGDCRSCVPVDDFFVLSIMNPDTMMPEKTMYVKAEQEYFHIFGQLTGGSYMCGGSNAHKELEDGYTFFRLDTKEFKVEPFELPEDLTAQELQRICQTNTPGEFITVASKKIGLWNLNNGLLIRNLCDNPGVYKTIVQDNIIYLVCKKEIHILRI